MRNKFLPFALPDIDGRERSQVLDVLKSGWLTPGPRTHAFEAEFAARLGVRHAIAVNSGTAAMHLALEAIGLERGDEVITTTYTFASSAEVVRYFDARPVFVDIDPETLNMCPELLERAITERTKAIIPVHIAGLPCDMDCILEVARRHKMPVIEGAEHAFPAQYKGRMVGTLGDFTCFSFHATMTITTGEGGMICTNNDLWAERCRVMALHGISKDACNRYTSEDSWYYEVVAPGFKYNMSDMASAIGLAQLGKAEHMWERRREIAQRYNEAFEGCDALQIPSNREDCEHAWHLYILRLKPGALRIDRTAFIEALKQRNISASVHFIPLHVHPYYRDTYGYKPDDFPVAYEEYRRAISLPIYSKMSECDVDDVIEAVLDIVATNQV